MKLTIVQFYAPTKDAADKYKEEFYDQLQTIKEIKIPKHKICIIM